MQHLINKYVFGTGTLAMRCITFCEQAQVYFEHTAIPALKSTIMDVQVNVTGTAFKHLQRTKTLYDALDPMLMTGKLTIPLFKSQFEYKDISELDSTEFQVIHSMTRTTGAVCGFLLEAFSHAPDEEADEIMKALGEFHVISRMLDGRLMPYESEQASGVEGILEDLLDKLTHGAHDHDCDNCDTAGECDIEDDVRAAKESETESDDPVGDLMRKSGIRSMNDDAEEDKLKGNTPPEA